MASGPMYLSTKPTSPERPRTSWSREETRMAPWICQSQGKTNTDYFWYSVSAFTANLHDSLTITDCFSFPLRHCKRSHKASCKQLFHFSVQTLSQRAESLTLCIIDLPRAFAPSRPRQDDPLAPDRSRSESTLPPRLQWELDTSTLAEPVWPGWE